MLPVNRLNKYSIARKLKKWEKLWKINLSKL